MKYQLTSRLAAWLLAIMVMMAGCAVEGQEEHADQPPADQLAGIYTAWDLEAFFLVGGQSAKLMADIDMGEVMLKLMPDRGEVSIDGNGFALRGAAPCVIRLEDGCNIQLRDIAIIAEQTGIGMLGDGALGAAQCSIIAGANALHAVGNVKLRAGSVLQLQAQEGSGLICAGLQLGEKSALQIAASTYGISAGRKDILLETDARIDCEAAGDNTLKVEGALILESGSICKITNNGDHNAGKIGNLIAAADATLLAAGGANGIGLFIVEQYEDITIQGACDPELHIENGKGAVTFQNGTEEETIP